MRASRFVGLAMAACAVIVFGALTISMPGCGGSSEVSEIKEDKPPTETMKDSMNYMQQKYAKKGSSKN
ncbi:hypothetical protein [Planctomyces sp. SH-PL62]|uniref:hypothetical protein n=1 Tax=Planctomyces sp. SH-PL62 TaxID=1636152 RepID=UPI00078C7F53|nr:hypothetical protein [Planctomyces sp. SH-PL62]AMV40275.1 hypothetical protein VT85_22785 [Planctomyces sp. SH-PL62]